MVFGKVDRERIMFNEDSLWLGDENDTGAYQAFGDVFVQLHPLAFLIDVSTTNQGQNGGQGVGQALDGDAESKWCFEHGNKEIVVDIAINGEATPLTEYSIVSGNDVPERDPSDWILQASNDKKTWLVLDHQNEHPQWSHRKQAESFKVKNETVYQYYQFVFQPSKKAPHFQVADIKLNIQAKESKTYSNYIRKLDIQQAVHTTDYTYAGVYYHREAFSSAPAGVMVFRFDADKKGAYTGVIELTDKHDAKISGQGTTPFASA